MKVVLINHSDTRGGASVVTLRLMDALRQAGVDARMIVMHKDTESPYVCTAEPAWLRKLCFLYEHEYIFTHNGFSRDTLFKISIANCGMPLHKHPWIKDADIVCLNWVNQGMLSLQEIRKIEAPVVWTMHDMWCITGVCHHAGKCAGYLKQCGHCHLISHGAKANDMSRSTYLRKKELYTAKKIHFVAVSSWLAQKCGESSLLKSEEVRIVPNAFPVDNFSDKPIRPRSAYGWPEDKKLIVMGAARLDDPIKGFEIAIDSLNRVEGNNITAIFFGDIRDKRLLEKLKIPYVSMGTIADATTLHDVYAHSSVVLSTSHYETLPGTLIEGMASGCVPVSFGHGGQPDIIDHKITGYIAKYLDASDVAAGIRRALDTPPSPEIMRKEVINRFGASNIAMRYIQLFENILNQQ